MSAAASVFATLTADILHVGLCRCSIDFVLGSPCLRHPKSISGKRHSAQAISHASFQLFHPAPVKHGHMEGTIKKYDRDGSDRSGLNEGPSCKFDQRQSHRQKSHAPSYSPDICRHGIVDHCRHALGEF